MSARWRIPLDEQLLVLFRGLVEVFGVEHEDVVFLFYLLVPVTLLGGDHDGREGSGGGDGQE